MKPTHAHRDDCFGVDDLVQIGIAFDWRYDGMTHLANCGSCQSELMALVHVHDALGEELPVPAGFADEVAEATAGLRGGRATPGPLAAVHGVATAAALALGLAPILRDGGGTGGGSGGASFSAIAIVATLGGVAVFAWQHCRTIQAVD